jgi:ribosomal protein L16/L10AE
VKPGKILFEMEGVTVTDAKEAMRLASHKLPLRTRFVKRDVLWKLRSLIAEVRGQNAEVKSEVGFS